MKKIFLVVQLMLTTVLVFGKVALEALLWTTSIYPTVHFIAPSKYYFSPGDDVYVKLMVNNNASYISYVDLFLGKEFIGRDNTSPYEWCKTNSTDHEQLRNMTSGKYSISAVVKYVDSKKKVLSRQFEVKSPYVAANQFDWLKKISESHANWNISEYRLGSQSYFKIYSCLSSSSMIYWYDSRGQVVSRQANNMNTPSRFSGARFVKSWYSPCAK